MNDLRYGFLIPVPTVPVCFRVVPHCSPLQSLASGCAHLRTLVLMLAVVSLLLGCAGTGGGLGSVEKTKHLAVGMKTSQVVALLGEPLESQAGPNKLIWKYSLHEYWKGFVPYYLVFERSSGRLRSWYANEAEYARQQELWLRALTPVQKNQGQKSPDDDCKKKYPVYEDRMCYCYNAC